MTLITDLYTQALDFISKNQFASGGLLVGATGVAVAAIRNAPRKLSAWGWRRITIEVEVNNHSDLFDAIEFWLAKNGLLNRTRVYRANFRPAPPKVVSNDGYDSPRGIGGGSFRVSPTPTDHSASIELSAGTGTHWFFFDRRLVLLSRVKEEKREASSHSPPPERFEISFFTRDRNITRRFFVAAVEACHPPQHRTVKVLTGGYESWKTSATPRVRPPESLVLTESVFDDLQRDIRTFFTNSDWYYEKGIPYRRGYLLFGPPGNGKTSTILALAGSFDLPVCVLDVGSPSMTDEKLRDQIASSPEGALLVLEDIDAVFTNRVKEEMPKNSPLGDDDPKGRLTFSGLLNALDGVATPDGRVVFMTTNHPEKLDPALVRPGRIDKRVEFKNACSEQARKMFLRFFPAMWDEAKAFAMTYGTGEFSMAQVQNRLIELTGEDLAGQGGGFFEASGQKVASNHLP